MSFNKVQEGHNVTVTTKPYTGRVHQVRSSGFSRDTKKYEIEVIGSDGGMKTFNSDSSEITINRPLPTKNGSVVLVTDNSFGVAPGYYYFLGGVWLNKRGVSIRSASFEGSDWVEVYFSAGQN